MRDDEIIAQVRKPNSDDNNSESDEDEVIETSKISNFDAFECFAKGLMWLKQQTDSDSTEFMLLKQLPDRAAERRRGGLVLWSRLRGRRVLDSKPDSTADPPCLWIWYKCPPAGVVQKLGERCAGSGIVQGSKLRGPFQNIPRNGTLI
ncbi:hypothetical protein AVEN_230902-1 [Araneus ventricosus]|uniref:Uncharacterized protein n=1 Tax=Araneus ventricosus TaxID=182803 RepID=A0A4Y2A3Y8_ARAVE|nr:hypothetical protein AVEN_230902-1 [Araneus ventricosus]